MCVRRFLVSSRAAEDAVIVLGNLPVDEALVPTPPSWQVAEKEAAAIREELVLLLVGSVLGEPFGWTNQQNGRLVHDVCPSKGQEDSLTSASSRQQLTLHTEDVFHSCRGDYVALMCLRNPDAVGTTVALVESVEFPEPVRRVLHQDRFRFFPDDSHHVVPQHSAESPSALEDRPYEVASVLFGPEEAPYLRIDADFTEAVPGDTRAEAALEAAAGLLAGAAERVVLSPGDAVFIDNHRAVHGRDTFTPDTTGRTAGSSGRVWSAICGAPTCGRSPVRGSSADAAGEDAAGRRLHAAVGEFGVRRVRVQHVADRAAADRAGADRFALAGGDHRLRRRGGDAPGGAARRGRRGPVRPQDGDAVLPGGAGRRVRRAGRAAVDGHRVAARAGECSPWSTGRRPPW